MVALRAAEVRIPASSVIVVRYNTPAMPPASSAISITTNGARFRAEETGLPAPTSREASIFDVRRCRRSYARREDAVLAADRPDVAVPPPADVATPLPAVRPAGCSMVVTMLPP